MNPLPDVPAAASADTSRSGQPPVKIEPPAAWSAVHRVAFRFWFAFVVAWLFPYPIGALPGTSWLGEFYQRGLDAIVSSVGARVLHLAQPIDVASNGSGDRTYDWIVLGIAVGIAVLAAATWTALDRRRSYPRLREGLRIAVRYEVGTSMVVYGLGKVFLGQFPAITPLRLLEAYGDSSPMALLWTFMSYSRAYCVFTGAAEVVGGLLLFHRRTTTLGALLLVGVMANVVVLNFCYDVPVKIYSTFLLVQVVWLLARNARALFGALVGATAARVTEIQLALGTPFRRRARLIAKAVYLLSMGWGAVKDLEPFSNAVVEPGPLEGYYEVASFSSPGASAPPTDAERWRRVVVGTYGQFQVQTQDGQVARLSITAEQGQPEVELRRHADGAKTKLHAAWPDPTHWSLDGALFDQPISVTLVKSRPPRSFLQERGFHWVNDYPLNR